MKDENISNELRASIITEGKSLFVDTTTKDRRRISDNWYSTLSASYKNDHSSREILLWHFNGYLSWIISAYSHYNNDKENATFNHFIGLIKRDLEDNLQIGIGWVKASKSKGLDHSDFLDFLKYSLIHVLKEMGIDIEKTTLFGVINNYFTQLISEFGKASISTVNNTVQTENRVKELDVRNFYRKIFTDKGYQIFCNFKECIEKESHLAKNKTAVYSRCFYFLKQKELIISTGADYMRFLKEQCQIEIPKIDSNQAGDNSRVDPHLHLAIEMVA